MDGTIFSASMLKMCCGVCCSDRHKLTQARRQARLWSPAANPANHIRSTPMWIIPSCTWQHSGVCSCSLNLLLQWERIFKKHGLIPEDQKGGKLVQALSWGRAHIPPDCQPTAEPGAWDETLQTASFSSSEVRLSIFLCVENGGGLFLSHCAFEVAKDVSPPEAKDF